MVELSQILLFLNMGPMEILVVLLFVLMFFGAESIPKIARGLGRTIREVKDAANEVQREMKDSTDQMGKDLDVKKEIEDAVDPKKDKE